ncbi:D-alanyl-D-alanine carboxypeptidase family protein [Micromonosporaceae bacterium Da 78-11]
MTHPARPDHESRREVPAMPVVPADRRPGGTVYGGAPTSVTPPPVKSRRGRLIAVPVIVVLFVGLLSTGVALQLNRVLPAATLSTSIATTLRIPGSAAAMPWPSTGSAELFVDGLGRLGGSGGSKPAAIGSVAKVMTAYVVMTDRPLADGEQGPGITVTATDVADYNSRIPSGQSLVPVAVGEVLTERDALEALMLPSANNVAHLLAQWVAGGQEAFVDRMNAAAAELGMKDSDYTDPSGFLPSTVSTAADQVVLGRAALKLPGFAEMVALRSATIPVAGEIKNYNDLLGVQGVFGIKTGSTTEAGGNLLFAAKLTVGDKTLTVIGAVFNQPGAHTPEQLARVNQVVRKLLAAVRRTVKIYTLLAADPVGAVRTAWGATTSVRPAEPLRVVGWPGLPVPVKVTRADPGADVDQGQVVGTVEAAEVRVQLRTDAGTADPDLWWKLSRKP